MGETAAAAEAGSAGSAEAAAVFSEGIAAVESVLGSDPVLVGTVSLPVSAVLEAAVWEAAVW